MNEKTFTLSDAVMKLIGNVNAYGDSGYDAEVMENLKDALPQVCEIVSRIFENMSRECDRYEWSMKEIGKIKLEWAKEIAEILADAISDCEEGATK